jgi:AcrR family transcriptional regulator
MATTAGPRAHDTRDAILDAALAVLERDGLRGSRMEDVAAEAGVSRQSVYYHFRSREEVLAALIDRGLAELGEAVRASAAAGSVEDFVLAAVQFFAENQTLCRLLITEMWGLAGDPHDPRRLVDRAEEELIGPVAARIAEAVRAGEADCADPVLAARALMGQITGVAFGLIVRSEPFDPDHVGSHLLAYARAVLRSGGGRAP